MDDTPPNIEIVLPATPESVALARQMVRGVLDVLDWEEDRRADIAIAVTEACTNAVLHAYPDGAADAVYEVLAWARPDRLDVVVRDFGRGMNPRLPSASAGLGLGLPLMLAIGDEVSFRSHEDGAATEVRLTFSPEMVPDVR
jgi:anti-sigma regulatory factor (Ser/Thr protein kinase)